MKSLKERLSFLYIMFIGCAFCISISSCKKDTDTETDTENLPEITGYPIVGTNQTTFYNNTTETTTQIAGDDFYGQNANYPGNTPSYVDNGDGTVTDMVTGLMWQQTFDHNADGNIDYADKFSYDNLLGLVENGVTYAGYNDWRLPDAKELQSIVDYSRSPATTNSAAIDPIFNCTQIINEAGEADYAWYWSSTTHANSSPFPGGSAAYVCFGRSLGYMNNSWVDIHDAGAQRSDTKSGDVSQYTQQDNGYYNPIAPQGDAIRTHN